MDYARGRPVEGQDLIDYVAISTSATVYTYYIGTMQAALNPTWTLRNFPGVYVNSTGGTAHPGFDAQQLLFYATEDTYVRFNDASNVPVLILAGMLITIPLKTSVIYVQRVTANGILYVWAVG